MQGRLLSRGAHHWVISLVLVALVVRALVPAGFMPSAERPFTVQICPDGFPAVLLHGDVGSKSPQSPGGWEAGLAGRDGASDLHAQHHHFASNDSAGGTGSPQSPGGSDHGSHHDHGGARAEHCVFAAVASAGPAPQLVVGLAHVEALAAPQFLSASPLHETQRFHVQQPRAPPALS